MSYTRTSIISLAGGLLGHKPIQTLDNSDDLITALNQIFDTQAQKVLGTGNWRFAIQIQQLTLSTEVPPPQTNFNQIYLLPAGYLKNIRIIPENYVYEIYANNQIWCNWGVQTPIYMEFAYYVPIYQWPSYFVDYFIYELACYGSLSNAQKPEYFAALRKEKNVAWAIAAATDAQNRPQFVDWEIPMLTKRNITGIIGPQIG